MQRLSEEVLMYEPWTETLPHARRPGTMNHHGHGRFTFGGRAVLDSTARAWLDIAPQATTRDGLSWRWQV
ncbi:hypothetical protein LY474_18370 [Myxococcus stipitatus]|uniref:hypothetical protein n=1 Tax=Myxococcus stipitatus TaxID=83455 RepID=UPI001F4059ED|nr:hypothetical protein [Myxococcus stipitatus]MCE9669765.1 hypothetical protein [Myxococcus stipitatus]